MTWIKSNATNLNPVANFIESATQVVARRDFAFRIVWKSGDDLDLVSAGCKGTSQRPWQRGRPALGIEPLT